jgi:nitroimidazol reductase NimA-like FMN-containing flavoprotein (pyridoxamine 5'-phosphate oxidase superfamily)
MRRKEKEIKDPQMLEQLIKEAQICRVAFHSDPYPYIVPMNYGYHENALYFHCALEGKKLNLLEANPMVGFEIEINERLETSEESCRWTTHYQSIFGQGEIAIIKDFDEKERGLDILMQQHGKSDNKYESKLVDRMHVLKLSIHQMTGKQSGDW